MTELGVWGMRWARGQMSDDELDVELLMYDFCRQLDPDTLPGGTTVLHFAFAGLENFPQWWIVVEEGKPVLCVDHPGRDVDVCVRTDIRTMIQIYAGDVSLSSVRREGRLEVSGSALLERSIAKWMPRMALAHVEAAEAVEA